jgi:hypothetical protein
MTVHVVTIHVAPMVYIGCIHTSASFSCSNSTISGNEAALGAGIYTDVGADLEFVNSSFTDNIAQQSGGAWFNSGANQVLQADEDTEIANNLAGCCYTSGYGSTLQKNSTSTTSRTCADVDSGM